MIKKLYLYMTNEKRIAQFRKLDRLMQKIGGKFYAKTLGRVKYKLRYSNVVKMDGATTESWDFERKSNRITAPLVSVIVPNYNHAPFLEERLESIYNQTYKNIEVILLDDCSKDNSREILSAYKEKYPEITTTVFNETNTGRVFKQWNKGLEIAKGELIWIAESDDYCESDFLEKMISLFVYDSVKLAFARSIFMQEGERIWSTEEYLHDLPELRWDAPFYMTANELVEKGFAIHNIIPNVSSAVFRNVGQVSEEVQSICSSMRLSGDWIFYLNMIKGSVVAYTNETTNYYRIHPQSTSLKVQKTEDYYKEFEQVSCYVVRNYKIKDEVFEIILSNLKEHYRLQADSVKTFDVSDYYSISKIIKEMQNRKPNIIMATYGLLSGGGETFPIFLANEMKRQGLAVTLLNFDMKPAEDRIVSLVNNDVPVVNLKHTDHIGAVLYHLGADVIHTHHASVDTAVTMWLLGNPGLAKHVITLHGMYEAIDKEDCKRVIRDTAKTCSKYAYVANKNLDCFKQLDAYKPENFEKIPNGLPKVAITPVERAALGISEDDFVFVLASRGIPEKGWAEAVEAIKIAKEKSERNLQLVILGDGEEKQRLEQDAPEYVHFVGTVSNVRDYYAMGDAGLLPSRFKGESYPLVICECMMSGRPVIATSIADVPEQIVDKEGNAAALLIELKDWQFSTEELALAMVKMANEPALYQELKKNTASVSKKFAIKEVAEKYLALYQNVIHEVVE